MTPERHCAYRKQYPSEEARKSEIARRLAVELEARLEHNKLEHRSATCLLNL